MMQGILIVDKPMDWTSFDVVAKLRGVLGNGALLGRVPGRSLGHRDVAGNAFPIERDGTAMDLGQTTRVVELLEVATDRRLRDAEARGQVDDRRRALSVDDVQDLGMALISEHPTPPPGRRRPTRRGHRS